MTLPALKDGIVVPIGMDFTRVFARNIKTRGSFPGMRSKA
jgi:hypothetical protein